MKYFITTLPGIEKISEQELVTRLSDVDILHVFRGRNQSSIVFEYPYDTKDIYKLRTIEDVYVLLDIFELQKSKEDLLRIREFQDKGLFPALQIHKDINNIKTGRGRTSFRVISQSAIDPVAYRRIDMQLTLEKAIKRKFENWKLVEDDSDIEFWIQAYITHGIIGLRISDKVMRHRDYKVANISASLRPTIAAAMVWLSKIDQTDVFLDPMCGAGTLLIERALSGRYKLIVGGDIDPDAFQATKQNIGNKHKPIEIYNWDAKNLPLESDSVNKIVCNLPFGKKIGTHDSNQDLYERFFREVSRLLASGGRCVLLTSEDVLIKKNLKLHHNLALIKQYSIEVLGFNAIIYVIDKI